jgi:hypothetical protein
LRRLVAALAGRLRGDAAVDLEMLAVVLAVHGVSASSGSARPCIARQWVVCCERLASHDRRRAPATRRKTRPLRRPLKRAPEILRTIADTHKGKRLRLFFQDESRIGQKGRVCRVWWKRGERPPGLCDRRFTFAYIFGAAKIGSDDAFALVMPEANTASMQIFLNRFSQTLPKDEVAVMYADQAGCTARRSCASLTT